MDGIRGLNSWQWMFLLEGIPMIPLGIIIIVFLQNVPDNTVTCKYGYSIKENSFYRCLSEI